METNKLLSWEDAVRWLCNQEGQQDLVRACFFDEPVAQAAERYYQCAEWTAIRACLPSAPLKVLDLGAGRGISSYAFYRDSYEITALEPDASDFVGAGCIRRINRDTGAGIKIVQANSESLPFAASSFDIVFCRQALHHAASLEHACSEMARVLKPGGCFIAVREHVLSRREDKDEFLRTHPLHHLYQGENAYLLDEYRDAIGNAGITITRQFNPYESDINLYPDDIKTIKRRLSRRYRWPLPDMIPDSIIRCLGRFNNTPGRLYSFIGYKAQ